MKLIINFDLIEKIKEANTGFSLTKTSKNIIKNTIFVSSITSIDNIIINYPIELTMAEILLNLSTQIFVFGTADLILSKTYKEIAIKLLKYLSIRLKDIDINTNYELLLKSYKYQTDYNVGFDKIPQLEQKKYIMVPILENGEQKELSIIQEHIIGSNKYVLSIGEPDKVFKLVLNQT